MLSSLNFISIFLFLFTLPSHFFHVHHPGARLFLPCQDKATEKPSRPEKKSYHRSPQYATRVQRDITAVRQEVNYLWSQVSKKSHRHDRMASDLATLKLDVIYVGSGTSKCLATVQECTKEIHTLRSMINVLQARVIETEEINKAIIDVLPMLVILCRESVSITKEVAKELNTQPIATPFPPLPPFPDPPFTSDPPPASQCSNCGGVSHAIETCPLLAKPNIDYLPRFKLDVSDGPPPEMINTCLHCGGPHRVDDCVLREKPNFG